jgi:hypothetical protein
LLHVGGKDLQYAARNVARYSRWKSFKRGKPRNSIYYGFECCSHTETGEYKDHRNENMAGNVDPSHSDKDSKSWDEGTLPSRNGKAGFAEGFGNVRTDDAYAIALQTYREMKEDIYEIGCQPDHIAYATMLQVVNRHTKQDSTERRQMVQVVFDDACVAGHVSNLVLKSLLAASPDKHLLASCLQSQDLADSIKSVEELPRAWSRSVPKQFRRS